MPWRECGEELTPHRIGVVRSGFGDLGPARIGDAGVHTASITINPLPSHPAALFQAGDPVGDCARIGAGDLRQVRHAGLLVGLRGEVEKEVKIEQGEAAGTFHIRVESGQDFGRSYEEGEPGKELVGGEKPIG